MNHTRALSHLARARSGQTATVDFVTPVVSAMIAAESLRQGGARAFEFVGPALAYAKHVGLLDAVAGKLPSVTRTGLAGESYSPVARLAEPSDVEAASDLVADCLHRHLSGRHEDLVNETCRIIGELHDNVASHSRGAGYSALQVYKAESIQFAVVDVGVGLLRNARVVVPEMDGHAQAIHWAFQKGNTSARPAGAMAQHLPEDAISNPFPSHVETKSSENHHMGEGLWQLLQLVGRLGGELWVFTGDAEMVVSRSSPLGEYRHQEMEWTGLAVEVTLPVQRLSYPDAPADDVSRRFGL